ncbi:MAG: SDR family oxidoreductase, partial [Gemmatimonadetes bacterium]|nr:SDR family oxidoreductase [Gemmatimonadota bacterium]
MRDMAGAFTLLTGAAGGLGPVIARTLAAEGCRLALSSHPADDLGPVVQAVRAAGSEAFALPMDLAEPGAADELAAQAESALGGLDILVNNAGVEKMAAYDLLTPEEIGRMIAINLTAPLLLTRAVLPGMLQRGRGHVVNLCSLAGIGPPPYGAPYAATKAGLIAFTRALRTECADRGVSASAICPGFVADA